jgi:hypothetical protein
MRTGCKHGGWTDAITKSPASSIIDVNVLRDELGPLLEDLSLDTGGGDHVKIRAALDQIKTEHWDQYMYPEEIDLANNTRRVFEEKIKDSSIDMIQMQRNNLDALQKYHGEYFYCTFDMDNVLEYGRSRFIRTKDGQRVVSYPAHFLLFSPGILLKVRFVLAKYYCFHLDMMLANEYLKLEEVERMYHLYAEI